MGHSVMVDIYLTNPLSMLFCRFSFGAKLSTISNFLSPSSLQTIIETKYFYRGVLINHVAFSRWLIRLCCVSRNARLIKITFMWSLSIKKTPRINQIAHFTCVQCILIKLSYNITIYVQEVVTHSILSFTI